MTRPDIFDREDLVVMCENPISTGYTAAKPEPREHLRCPARRVAKPKVAASAALESAASILAELYGLGLYTY